MGASALAIGVVAVADPVLEPAGATVGLHAGFDYEEGAGTTTQDRSGNGFTADITSGTWTTTGRYGSALAFNGSSTRVRTAASVTLPTSFTMMAWVRNPSNSGYETIMTVGPSRDVLLKNGTPTFYNGSSDLNLGGKVPVGSWNHLAVVYNGTRLLAYVNATVTGAGRTASLPQTSGPFQVGAWMSATSNDDYFSGTLDEVQVYQRALTVAEIQADMGSPLTPPVPDATAPLVSVASPASGATVVGSLDVAASASDNVAVTGVQFLVDGANLGAEDTTSPYSVTWNTAATANGTHTLTARARDAAGNQRTSAPVEVTVSNVAPSPTAPLVAYAFNEGSGTAISDASGHDANATATGTTWTANGRYGSGLGFNGATSRVRSVGDVTLPSAFTFEAWILNPTADNYESVLTLGSSRDLYLANGMLTFWTGSADLTFGSVPVGAWAHVAVTYDGASLRAYVNGNSLGSPRSAVLGAVTAPLQVGAWISAGSNDDFFSGTLDEVRVHGRALSADEVQTDMNAPIGQGGADLSAPMLSNAQPSGVLSPATTQTELQVTTSESATCRYGATPNVAYESLPVTFALTGGTAHSTPVSGLQAGTSYSYYVRCRDAAGNANSADQLIMFSVASSSVNLSSLRFFGNGVNQIDRVEVPLTPGSSLNVGGHFTIEWWMRADAGNTSTGGCGTGNNAWITGNVLIDRDVYGDGDFGDYGVSLFGSGVLAFGVSRGSTGATVCSTIGVADGGWHHVALTRNTTTGQLAIYVDGQPRGTTVGPTGNVAYRDGRTGADNDPVLVFGAEKHDAGSSFPSYHGWLDDVRISSTVRYSGAFVVPTGPLPVEPSTVALYRFDEGSGTVALDATGDDHGVVLYGGNPAGPVWSTAVPF